MAISRYIGTQERRGDQRLGGQNGERDLLFARSRSAEACEQQGQRGFPNGYRSRCHPQSLIRVDAEDLLQKSLRSISQMLFMEPKGKRQAVTVWTADALYDTALRAVKAHE